MVCIHLSLRALSCKPPIINPGVWVLLASASIARIYSSSAVIGNKLYVFAGDLSNNVRTGTLYAYNFDTTSWVLVSTLSTNPRRATTLEAIDGKLYVHGGFSSSAILIDTWVYDPVANTWTAKANGLYSSNGHSSVNHNGKMYLYGGYGNLAGTNQRLDKMRKYDPATNVWTPLTSGPVALVGPAMGIIGNKIYVFAGADTSAIGGCNAFFVYDILLDTWDVIDIPRPPARTGHVSWVDDNKFYIAGGTDSSSSLLSDTWVYDPVTNLWTELTPMVKATSNATANIHAGVTYMFGGKTVDMVISNALCSFIK